MARRWENKFIEALENSANITQSAEAAGITRQAAYNYRKESPEFAQRWDDALQMSVGTLEDEAVRRARDGVEEPIYQRGEYMGTVRRYSDTLLIFLLKAHKPTVYNPPNVVSGPYDKDGTPGPIELTWRDVVEQARKERDGSDSA